MFRWNRDKAYISIKKPIWILFICPQTNKYFIKLPPDQVTIIVQATTLLIVKDKLIEKHRNPEQLYSVIWGKDYSYNVYTT